MKGKRIVTIGGGTGTFTILSGLKKYPVALAAIVSMADDGGSTGRLRDEYGVLPAGDVRRALVALAASSERLRDLFNYRFTKGGLKGHNFGNLFLAALQQISGSFEAALGEVARLLQIKGEVIPVTLDDIRLYARLSDGKILKGERHIDIPRSLARAPIEKVWLKPKAKLNPRVRQVLEGADLIVIGPGDLYTSIIPNLLVSGMPGAIRRSKAKKVYVASLMTKFGETHGFRPDDFVSTVEDYLGKNVLDFAIFNRKKPKTSILARYKKEKAEFIDPTGLTLKSRPKYLLADLLDGGKFVRHNASKLAKLVISLI